MAILLYHAIDPYWRSPLSVPPADFERQLAWLVDHHPVVPVDVAVRHLSPSGNVRDGAVALTFDDGFASVHEYALPALLRLGVRATAFVVAGTLDTPPHPVDWVDDADGRGYSPAPMTIDQVLELHDAGMQIGSHGLGHRTLPDLSDAELLRELRDSRALLEDLLHEPVTTLAYPRSLHDARVRAATRAAGYSCAFGFFERGASDGYAIERSGISGNDSWPAFRLKLTTAYLPMRTSSTPVLPSVVRSTRNLLRSPLLLPDRYPGAFATPRPEKVTR